ncbi:MAG: molybdopterin-dependent oxidoreductase [Deltaproteobacteria bacterium]|nr:molybdopterin-dependent oxidoreductase [Deltaproteobacteria bacterium]
MSSYTVIGKPTPMVGSREKVTGKAKFTDDIRVANPLIVGLLRSPLASAKISRLDLSAALALEGVRAGVTGKDFDSTIGVLPISRDEPPLARDCVRYVGEPVAAIAAESSSLCRQALELIRVEYDPIEPCLDSRKALKETSHPIHPELKKPSNLHKSVTQQFGNLEKGFASAQAVVEGSFDFAPLTHAFTEPFATQVEIDTDSNLTVYSATQVPHYLHLALSGALQLPLHKIRVVKPYLGGGFGGKSDPLPHEIVAARLALISGRNVRLLLDREETFFTSHGRHPTQIGMRLGLHSKKGITALSGEMLIDGGAYASYGVVTSYYNGVLLQGPYPIPNLSFHCDRVYTNKLTCGAMRGHGGVNPRFASEVLLDMACEKLQLDPCETRLRLIHKAETLTVNQFRITSCGLKEGLATAMERSRWKEKVKKLPFGRGIGVACGFFISGSALPIHWNKIPQSTVRLTIDFDGAVTVYSGASDIGQGSDTVLAQMVAEVLGISLSHIKVISADTRLCPVDLGSYSSRVTFMAGNAARNAAIRMRKGLVAAACGILEIKPPRYRNPKPAESFFRQGGRKPDFDSAYLGPNPDYSDGFLFQDAKISALSGKAKGKQLDYFEVVKTAVEDHGTLQTQGIYLSPKLGGTFKGAGAGLSPSYSFTAFITEVTVNPQTGFIKVDKVTCAHDCGQPLNPMAVEGQIEGSIHMGLGQALMEGLDYVNGAVQNASFLEYKIPSAFEQPEIEMIYDLSRDNEGPFGAKEAGEGVLAPIIPSVANAIYDAVGIRLCSVPMTPDKVLAALNAKRGNHT